MSGAVNLGLKANLNLLVAYDPLWPAAFAEEEARLAEALGPVAKGIEHYGSTAVPGLCAKPVLDIMVGVSPRSDWEKCKPALGAMGYDYAEGAGVPGHYIFGRGRDRTERTHLVHVVEYKLIYSPELMCAPRVQECGNEACIRRDRLAGRELVRLSVPRNRHCQPG